LPQEQRDILRDRKVPAKEVIRLFNFDHIVLYALGGSDLWWNLDPKLLIIHREKSRTDTGIVAKVRRLAPEWNEFVRKMAKPDKGRTRNKERKRKFIGQCPHCYFHISSYNPHYITVRMLRHTMAKHPHHGNK